MVCAFAGVRALGTRVRKLLFSFDGRVSRAPYWLVLLAVLFIDLVAFGAAGGFELFDGDTMAVECNDAFWALLVVLPSLWIGLVVTVRRLHDRNKSGRWVLVNLVPVVGWLWTLIECGILRGTTGPNRFGQDPLRPRANAVA
jgi:uncharacterized membrane protein YhaH (DUF805 family)